METGHGVIACHKQPPHSVHQKNHAYVCPTSNFRGSYPLMQALMNCPGSCSLEHFSQRTEGEQYWSHPSPLWGLKTKNPRSKAPKEHTFSIVRILGPLCGRYAYWCSQRIIFDTHIHTQTHTFTHTIPHTILHNFILITTPKPHHPS